MRYRDGRRSVCVSSQSGCPLTCTFCATGTMKFGRNLTAVEILDQALHFRRIEDVDHCVFMGMGEPMMNLDDVLAACRRLPDLGITNRRTAISTVGWIPGIDALGRVRLPVRLALSLHAPDDALRSEIMPVNERYPLRRRARRVRALVRAPSRRMVFIEYVMLAGVNDRYEQALALAELLDPRRYKVNLIPYNPTGSAYDGSSREAIAAFRDVLEEHGCARPCGSRAARTSTRPAGSWRRRRSRAEQRDAGVRRGLADRRDRAVPAGGAGPVVSGVAVRVVLPQPRLRRRRHAGAQVARAEQAIAQVGLLVGRRVPLAGRAGRRSRRGRRA